MRDKKQPKKYYHIQYSAGTMLWDMEKKNGEYAPQACSQRERQCLISYDERVEASNLLQSNMRYIPREFPLPFVNARIRRNFYFMTILRNPFDRMLSHHLRRKHPSEHEHNILWKELRRDKDDAYGANNFIVRWLAGVPAAREIGQEDVDLAKCHLDLFDLVLTDQTVKAGLSQIICPSRNWKKCEPGLRPKSRNNTNPLV
jgi:hypothetical protein